MAASTRAWDELVAELAPQMSDEWTRRAREDGAQPWIRLILLVDAHHRLSAPGVNEKIAATMGELAVEREREQAGWQEVQEHERLAREARMSALLAAAPNVLGDEQLPLFERSIEPVARI
jgi:hypothetical protein